MILLSLLQGFTEEVFGDSLLLACYRATDYAVAAGLDKAEVKGVINQFLAIAKHNGKKNPISGLF